MHLTLLGGEAPPKTTLQNAQGPSRVFDTTEGEIKNFCVDTTEGEIKNF